jgi:formate dehydrogenase subunit beta
MSKLKGASIPAKTGTEKTIIGLFEKAMDKNVFDAVMMPMKVPNKDAFAYVLIKDKNLLKQGFPIPPTMFVQGAKAVSSMTRLGAGRLKIAVILRPCELRAVVELIKVGQINNENLTLISFDCPGVLPTSVFLADPEKEFKNFKENAKKLDDKIMRPVCQICDKSSMVAGDIHIGTLGGKKDTLFFISNSKKGEAIADKLGLSLKNNIDPWEEKVKTISEEKLKKRKKAHKELKAKVGGIENLVETFAHCINCHNCMRVCPVCFCRLCYFDSDKVRHPAEEYLDKAQRKGSIRFLPDTTLFQMGRMMHMSLSCVSCGACEDACSMSIPVAQVFSMIADETQSLFDYVSGRSIDEPIPLVTYKEEELKQMEDAND